MLEWLRRRRSKARKPEADEPQAPRPDPDPDPIDELIRIIGEQEPRQRPNAPATYPCARPPKRR